jgi:hypothetical protein
MKHIYGRLYLYKGIIPCFRLDSWKDARVANIGLAMVVAGLVIIILSR